MYGHDPERSRQFALHVVETLRLAGYEAYWAGGCVRDALMGRTPVDYDVATAATPEQIRQTFGRNRTLAIGAAFGVMTIVGPAGAAPVQVATFRADAGYSDGRHPDRVLYTTAEADAQRRDFTINGLFLDPSADRVLDFVGGQADLQRRIIRAIGDPRERIAEDKLRMLRAVRFATTLDFQLDEATLAAIQQHAREIRVVSGERIAEEMRKLLAHPDRRRGVELLAQSELLAEILPPEFSLVTRDLDGLQVLPDWSVTLEILQTLQSPTFGVALAALARADGLDLTAALARIAAVGSLWRLSTVETEGARLCLQQETLLRKAVETPWSRLQRALIEPRIEESLCLAEAVARVVDGTVQHIEFCRRMLAQPAQKLNPPPLITGQDLLRLGIPRGPVYREILDRVRDEQLEGRLANSAEARALAASLAPDGSRAP